MGEVDGTPVAVSAGDDRTVRMWDLRTGLTPGAPLSDPSRRALAVAVGEVDGSPVAVSGQDDDTVRVWDLGTGAARGEPIRGHSGAVGAVAVGEVDGTPVAVSGDNDGTVRVWDLRTGAARGGPLTGDFRHVYAVAVGEVDGAPVAISGGYDGTVRVWDLRPGAAPRAPLRCGGTFRRLGSRLHLRMGDAVWAVAAGEVDGTPVAVSGGPNGKVRVWDLRTGAPRGGPLTGHIAAITAVAVGEVDGTPVAVSAGNDRTVRVWDLRTGAPRGGPLTGHTAAITAVTVGEVDGTPVAVSGDDNGVILLRALGRDQYASARIDAPAGVLAIVSDGRARWLTATEDGSLFLCASKTGTTAAEAGKDRVPSSDLGGLVSEFRGRIPVLRWLLFATLVGFGVRHIFSLAPIIFGVIVAGWGLLLARNGARELNVKVHSEGLVYQGTGKSEAWRWKEVEELSIITEKRKFHSPFHNTVEALISGVLDTVMTSLLPKAAKYQVGYRLWRPGHELVLGWSIKDYKRLGEIVENFVRNSRVPLVMASFRAGNTIPFGKLLIGPDGLTDARTKPPRLLPLEALAGVSVSNYVVTVNQVGEKAPWTSAEATAVPNAAILAALAERVVSEKTMP